MIKVISKYIVMCNNVTVLIGWVNTTFRIFKIILNYYYEIIISKYIIH